MIRRDPRHSAAFGYDLIVVGGGVYGVMTALEAARRGRRALLVERDDFGAATSWNSLRIVHGGLRYLQTADLRRFRESVAERSWLLRHFPDLVRPLPCLMPLYGDGLRRRDVMRVALRANDLLSLDRNRGLRPDRRLPRGEVLTAEATRARYPSADPVGLEGGALWHDAVMTSSQRLLVEALRWAAKAGARALNYVEAAELLTVRGKVAGVRCVDRETGETYDYQATVVVNCAGPWSRALAARFDRDLPPLFRPSLAFNVLLDREPLSELALAVTARRPGARTYFMYPWRDRILAGTFHAPWSGTPGAVVPDDALVAQFLREFDEAAPLLDLRPADVLRVYAGLLPAAAEGAADLAVREVIHHHGAHGGPQGLFSVSGVKFTTARRVAQKTLAAVWAHRAWGPLARPTTPRPEPREVPEAESLEALAAAEPARAAQLVRQLVQEEAVLHLDDLLLRRTDWGMDPRRARPMADLVTKLLGWDAARSATELARLTRPPASAGAA